LCQRLDIASIEVPIVQFAEFDLRCLHMQVVGRGDTPVQITGEVLRSQPVEGFPLPRISIQGPQVRLYLPELVHMGLVEQLAFRRKIFCLSGVPAPHLVFVCIAPQAQETTSIRPHPAKPKNCSGRDSEIALQDSSNLLVWKA
jgi:hypothetical protein